MRWATLSGMGTVTHLSQPRRQKGHREREWLHLPEGLPRSELLGFLPSRHKTQGKEAGEAQYPHRPPRSVLPPAGCEHVTCAHVLCCGIGENNSHHTCTPTAESQSKKNNKVEAVLQPGEELDPQGPSVTESGESSFLPSWVFFDSGERMKNHPIGEDQGYSDMAPVLEKLRGWRSPRICGQRTRARGLRRGALLGPRVRQRLHLL